MIDLHRVQCRECRVDRAIPAGTWVTCTSPAATHPQLPEIPGGYCLQRSIGPITIQKWEQLQADEAQALLRIGRDD